MNRLHILGIPHTKTTREKPFNCCAYTQKIIKKIEMVERLGYECILYSNAESDVNVSELVPVTSAKDYTDTFGDKDFMSSEFEFGQGAMHENFNKNTAKELAKRLRPKDIVLCTWGTGHTEVLDRIASAHGMDMLDKAFVVEPFVGYPFTFAPYRVYESYSRLNSDIGALNRSFDILQDGIEHGGYEARHYTLPRHEDFVIPPYFDPNEFLFSEEKSDFYLFIGRITESKGLKEAIRLADVMNKRLIVCGQGTPDTFREAMGHGIPDFVDFMGAVDIDTRKLLYRDAELVVMFTYYPEPGGNVFFESIASGTPVITSNRGIFPEVNYQGVTGYRCKSFRDMVTAAENIHLIDNTVCYNYAMHNFSVDRVSLIYDAYYQHIQHLRDEDYFAFEKNRSVAALDWLVRPYSAEQIQSYTDTVIKRNRDAKKLQSQVEESDIQKILQNADPDTKQSILKQLSEGV